MSRRRQHPNDERELCDAVHRAFGQIGWVLPTSEDAVADAEKRLCDGDEEAQETAPLPFAAVAAGEPTAKDRWAVLPRPSSPVEKTLARAAREGGPLSPEVEQAMHRDRDAAEARTRTQPTGPADHDE